MYKKKLKIKIIKLFKLTDSAVEIATAVCGQPRNDTKTPFLSLRGVPFRDDEAISNHKLYFI